LSHGALSDYSQEEVTVIKQLTALTAVLTVACGGPDITVRRDATVPVPKAATWAWGVRDTVSHYELDPVAQNAMLHSRVKQSIETTLGQKGWKRVEDASQAQLIVTYHIGLKRTTEMVGTTSTMGGSGWWGGYGWGVYGAPTYSSTNIRPVDYTTGGLLVLVRDRGTGNLAWEGLYKKEVENTDRIRVENLQKAVDELLADLQ
jgi:hypothetical protein